MSFYGQVLYEFTKLFSKINISNNTTQTVSTAALGSQPSLVAADQWDQIDIKGGNHWIRLTSDSKNKDLTITHAGPGTVDSSRTVISFKPLTQEEVDALPQGTTITPLSAEQCFQTTKSEYDNAGHSVSAQTEYFSLPISATELDLNIIKEKHLTVPKTDEHEYEIDIDHKGISIANYLSENKYLQQDYLENAMSIYLNENNYVTTATTGNINTIYPTIADNVTIVDGMGLMDNSKGGLSKAINDYLEASGADAKLYSLSEACILLLQHIKELEKNYDTLIANYALQVELIQDLRERVSLLEGK